jgi:peroxiredoxin Q/BCP|tara:strand:- start:432 stop:929 length:498 start_codon:yes stop_codon:yes gene_type:complete
MHWGNGGIEVDPHANLIGEKFPNFSLKDTEKNTVERENLLGRWSVIFFYPKDGSPGCTIESCTFRDKQEEIEALGAQIIGISSDSVSRHQRFKKKHRLQYTLLSDPQSRLAKKMRLKRTLGFMRARVTFVIDPNGIIQGTVTSQFNPIKHVKSAIRQLEELTVPV